jgi:enamine deaminase RidA (YjgF/YER057c/UK114 family)
MIFAESIETRHSLGLAVLIRRRSKAGPFIFLSGQEPFDTATRNLLGSDTQTQLRTCTTNR